MKLLAPLVIAPLACAILGNAVAAELIVPMPPAAAQKEASLWAARVVDRYRYKPESQPNGNSHPFDRFVQALDPDRMVFTQADLAAMDGQRALLGKLSDAKQMEVPNAIFGVFLTRAIAAHAYALEVLSQPLNFNGQERFQRARSKAAWEPDEAALRDMWRRSVMDEYLDLRIAGVPEAQIAATLRGRYDRQLQRLQAMRNDDVANIFLNAYVESFDPHGAYLEPFKASDRKLADLASTGLVLKNVGNFATVMELAPGSPAGRSGEIHIGDRIVGIAQDGGQPVQDVVGWRINDVVDQLRGATGSQVVLDILPQGVARSSTPRRIILTRAKVRLDEQRAKGRIESLQHGATTYRVGVITVPTFYQDFSARKAGAKDYISVTRDVAAALEQMKAQNADAVLLDMRNNVGGSLIEAVELTGLFLPGAQVAQQLTYDRKVTTETAPAGVPAWDGPLAVLIDRRSAAATEIAAGAIQDYGRGLIIGDVSFGRGSVQTLVNLSRFAADSEKQLGELKLTIAMLCRAGGKPIQPAGVTPDIVVPGQIDFTGKANADLFPGTACKTQSIPKSTNLDALLPTLAKLHERRMQANRSYQAQIAWRAKEEAHLSNDDISLNEIERRRSQNTKPDAEITQMQLAEALQVLGDTIELMRKNPGLAGKEPQ